MLHNMLWRLQVSGHTPGGAATFVGCQDRTPGLILTTPESNMKDNQSIRTWLSASPCLSSSTQNLAPCQTAPGKQGQQVAGVLPSDCCCHWQFWCVQTCKPHGSSAVPLQLCGHHPCQISSLPDQCQDTANHPACLPCY